MNKQTNPSAKSKELRTNVQTEFLQQIAFAEMFIDMKDERTITK